MKKVFLTIMAVCLAMGARAVDLPKQGLGIQLGWARPTLRVNDPNAKDSLSHHIPLNGFKAGLVYDASYIAGFGSTIGINYTFGVSNGGWQQRYPNNDYPEDRTMITYSEVELFVDWQYKFEVAKETYLMLYTGPTIQCGLALNWRRDTRDMPIDPVTHLPSEEVVYTRGDRVNTYVTDDGTNSFQRLNITWGVGAGFQYKRYFLRGGYDFGLLNPYKSADFANGVHTRGRFDQWSIKLGVYFWYKD